MSDEKPFQALGNKVTSFQGFETFERPAGGGDVVMESDEVTAVCPVTGQPDFYRVSISYTPFRKCLESKTLKLYLGSLRDQGMFCEALATKICKDVNQALEAEAINVTVIQKPRGGVSITAQASSRRNP